MNTTTKAITALACAVAFFFMAIGGAIEVRKEINRQVVAGYRQGYQQGVQNADPQTLRTQWNAGYHQAAIDSYYGKLTYKFEESNTGEAIVWTLTEKITSAKPPERIALMDELPALDQTKKPVEKRKR